ncbi:hypothetical protein YC2023_017817 [Brassica napus]
MASPIIGGRSYGRSSNHRFGSGSQEPLSPALSPTPVANSEPSVHMEDSYVEANNEDYSFIAVMKKTHQRPDGTEFRSTWKNVWDSSNLLAAGMSKQGRVFGLGALHSKILPACDVSSNAPEASEEVEMITQRLQEVEAELKPSREENLQFQKRLENMETLVQSITNLSV